MKYPYFRGLEADRYSFYRVPKALIKVDLFEKMSGDAKLLYAVLLDRMNLSLKNGWQDENGNAYIICTIDEIMDSIRCARQKAVKLLDELEHEYQLIERRRQGLGKPNLLYVKDLYAGLSQSNYWKYENQTSGGLKSELPGVWKSNGSKTDINNTDSSETDLIYSAQSGENISGEMREDERYRFYFQDKLEIPILEKNFPHDREILMEILELLVETVTSRKKFLRICGEEKPKEVVKSRLMKLDSMHMEYAQMLKQQLAKGNNGLVRTKYITFSIEAKSVKEAKPRLERIETDILNNFKVLGVKAYPLNGVERLQIMYEMFHQEEERKFEFSYDRILQSGMTTKDFIAPTSFLFKSGKDFQMGDTIGAVSYLNILAPELTDKVLAEFLDMDKNLVVSIHVQSVDQLKAIKLIKGKITDLDRMKIEEQKKAVRSGYDMEIIPSDLATYGGEAKKILDDLQSRNERMFLITVLFLNAAKTKQDLDSAVFQTAGIAQKFNCTLNRLDYMQEQGLMSSLPLANNLVPIKRALTTTSTAIFVPFTTQELFMEGDSLYYGLNAVSNNMIMADRKQLKNPNGLILGTPGSGKSFSAKREMTNVFFTTTDDIIIADPEGEYYPLVEALGGQVIHISSTSRDYINPMDINLNYADDDNPLGMKSDFILSLCELIMGARDGMEPEEKSVID